MSAVLTPGISFNWHKLLRKKAVARFVLWTKFALTGFMVICGALIMSEGMDNTIAVDTTLNTIKTDAAAAMNAAQDRGHRKTKKRDFDGLARSNLFGTLAAQTTSKPMEPPKPVIKNPLTLIGTFIVDGETATAIIEEPKKKLQEVFAVGDMVFDEAKLIDIKSDKVVIERQGGAKEELVLDEGASSSASTASGEFKDGIAIVSDNEVWVQEAELDKALENLPLLLTQARAVPYFKDGKSIGLRLFAVKQGSIFERLGLKNGDVLKSINGSPMGDLSQAIKLFETLKQERNINVQLERDRNEKEVRFQIR
jgi:general secretion pathway protein C